LPNDWLLALWCSSYLYPCYPFLLGLHCGAAGTCTLAICSCEVVGIVVQLVPVPLLSIPAWLMASWCSLYLYPCCLFLCSWQCIGAQTSDHCIGCWHRGAACTCTLAIHFCGPRQFIRTHHVVSLKLISCPQSFWTYSE
jgi:hypothetical protein